LECFQLYGTTIFRDKEARLDDLVASFVSTHGLRLKRFSLHRLPVSLKALDYVCVGFPNLEQLFIVVEQEDLVSATLGIRRAVHESVSGIHRELIIESRQTPSCPCQFF
jgi:hypothetical protein